MQKLTEGDNEIVIALSPLLGSPQPVKKRAVAVTVEVERKSGMCFIVCVFLGVTVRPVRIAPP